MDSLDGRSLATAKSFDARGQLVDESVVTLEGPGAASLATRLVGARCQVIAIAETPRVQRPQPPFMTSSLQIEASRKLRFDPERTMRAAQRLYEQGWITYMRTDSTTLSSEALDAARRTATELYGAEYVASAPRRYDRSVKNAQEAHEAIRPAGATFRTLEEAEAVWGGDERVLYELIWKRTLASQMVDARLRQRRVRLGATLSDPDQSVEMVASGLQIEFAGFRRAYVEGADDPEAELADQERLLPPLAEGDPVAIVTAEARDHQTQPPDRYSEATLIKQLEDLGIGRPSTYASIMKTIDRRGYVWKKGKALVPTFRAFAVVNLLEAYFADLVDYQFTAAMEDDLDAIADGHQDLEPWLRRFYFGDPAATSEFARRGLHRATREAGDFDFAAINSIALGVAPDGLPVSVRSGRYGPYLVHGEERVSIPEATEPDTLSVERALELLAAPAGDRVVGVDPASGEEVLVKTGRYGPYVQLGEPSGGKPRTASLLASMSPETLSLEQALALLALPRELGRHPVDGEPVLVNHGRYGAYVTWGSETRSLAEEDQVLTATLEEALALLAQPKARGRRAAAGPLRELGEDPVTHRPVVVRTGRFGPYVSDGESNATLRLGDTPETITLERAGELLAERRNSEPRAPRATRPRAAAPRPGTAQVVKASRSTAARAAKRPGRAATPRRPRSAK